MVARGGKKGNSGLTEPSMAKARQVYTGVRLCREMETGLYVHGIADPKEAADLLREEEEEEGRSVSCDEGR